MADFGMPLPSDSTLQASFPNSCRVCMRSNVVLKNAFSTELARTVEDLMFCTGILMTEEDGLPVLLCDTCLATLSVAFEFKTTCIRSDMLFRQILREKVVVIIKEEVLEEFNEDMKLEVNSDVDDCMTNQEVMEGEENDADDYNADISHVQDEQQDTKPTDKKTKPVRTRQKKKGKTNIDSGFETTQKSQHLHCDVCGLSFTSKELCLEHNRKLHTPKWICEVCGKQFVYRSSHHSHVKTHLPPTFKCSACDYKTWYKADMKKHIRTHTGVRQYVCEFCTSAFKNTSNLHEHIRRVHSGGDKTKVCPRCGHAFYTEDKLRRHLDTHDNIKRFECEVCHTQFTRRCHWKKHLQKQHSITVPHMRPGRQKVNDVSGAILEENMHVIEAI